MKTILIQFLFFSILFYFVPSARDDDDVLRYNPKRKNVWEDQRTILPERLFDYGAHKVVTIQSRLYEFGGIEENRTEFWLSGGEVSGWVNDSYNFVRFYDPSFNHYIIPTQLGPIAPPRAWPGMAAYKDSFFFMGGINLEFQPLGDFWRCDVLNYTHVRLMQIPLGCPQCPTRRVGTALEHVKLDGTDYILLDSGLDIQLINGTVAFVNLNDTYLYNIKANIWKRLTTTNTPIGRSLHASAIVEKKILGKTVKCYYRYGGEGFNVTAINPDTGRPGYVKYRDDMWFLNLNTFAWTEVMQVNKPRINLHWAWVQVGNNEWHFHGGDFGNCTSLDLINDNNNVYLFKENKWILDYIPGYADRGVAGKRFQMSCIERNGENEKDLKKETVCYQTGGFRSVQYNGYMCTQRDIIYVNSVFSYIPYNQYLDWAIMMNT